MMMDYDDAKKYGRIQLVEDVSNHIDLLVHFWGSLRLSNVGAKFHIVKDHLS